MKLYVAGPWASKDVMPDVARQFEQCGHVITHKWWDVDGDDNSTSEYLAECADADLMGVKNCDILVVINSAKSEGKAFEQGAAAVLGKPILIVGKKGEFPNIFHHLPIYHWVPDMDAAVKALGVIQWLVTGGAANGSES